MIKLIRQIKGTSLGVFLSLIAMGCFSTAAHGNDSSQDVFYFNVSPNGYPPYLIVDSDEPSGIMWDVVKLIVPRLGYRVEPRKVPRKRVDQMLIDGYIDGTSRAIEWTEEAGKFLFSDPVVNVEEVFFFPVNSSLDFNEPSDLFGKTVVTHLGYLYPSLAPYFENQQIKRFDVSRDRDMFRFLRHGERFDAALADRLVGQWILRNEGVAHEFRSSRRSISQYGFRLMLRPDWQEFAQAFNQELGRIRDNGELDTILSNYR